VKVFTSLGTVSSHH